MTVQSLAETLETVREELTSMNPASIVEIEHRMHQALSLLSSEVAENPDASCLAASLAQLGQIRALAGHASSLYLGWLHLVSSATCGYTPSGPAQLLPQPQFITEG